MKLFTGWCCGRAGFSAAAANAQGSAPDQTAGAPSGCPISAAPMRRCRRRPGPALGPTLLPPTEVYTVLRENGFSPLGIPQRRGHFYTISVIDRGGDDGRLVIDARNGRIVRFVPACRIGRHFDGDLAATYGPRRPAAADPVRGAPRPPASVPHVASRTVPVPKPSPLRRQACRPAGASSRRRCSRSQPTRKQPSRRPQATAQSSRPSPLRRPFSRPRKCRRCRG